jgi:hypothetical protein
LIMLEKWSHRIQSILLEFISPNSKLRITKAK